MNYLFKKHSDEWSMVLDAVWDMHQESGEKLEEMKSIKTNNNKQMSKTTVKEKKVMELDSKIVKLDRESYGKLKDMFSSPDKENHVVAFSILENLDAKTNLPFLLLLYKLYKDTTGDGWKVITPKMEKVLKSLDKGKLDNVTFNNLWKIVHGNFPKEELQVIVDEYSEILKGHVTEWGFQFLKHCDWKITVR